MALPKFTAALLHHKGNLDYATYWRYRNGKLPKLLVWLGEQPDLAEALAEDARARMVDREKSHEATHLD